MLSKTSPIQLREERNEELHKQKEKTRHQLEDTDVELQDMILAIPNMILDAFGHLRRVLSKNVAASWIAILSSSLPLEVHLHSMMDYL